jgi:DNA-binding transcriptional regulator YiaG
MMTHAYDDIYLEDAMSTLGEAVEYAVLFCNLKGQEFLRLFLISGIAEEFGKGNVTYISGMSGIELASKVLSICGIEPQEPMELPYISYPTEYWIGWIYAYYQWHSGKEFKVIFDRLDYDTVYDLYVVLHEADESKSVEVFDAIIERERETNLARLRKYYELSQSQLAKASGVSIRSIQLYEQRKNDINHAQYNHLKALSKVLRCEVRDILE